MNRLLLVVAMTLAAAGVGCKGEPQIQPDPETLKQLEACQQLAGQKDDYIKDLEKRLAELEMNGGGDAVVVNIEGEAMKITGKGPNRRAGKPRGETDGTKLYEAFVASLKRSRGGIQKCYQNALKKNSSLQARTVTLKINVNYRVNGAVKSATFNPRISSEFDQCMGGITKRWTLPAMARAVTFNYKQTLTPE